MKSVEAKLTRLVIVLCAGSLAWLAASSEAAACEQYLDVATLEIQQDASPPDQPLETAMLDVEQVKRGVGPRGTTRSECDRAGWVTLQVRNPRAEVGYEFEVVGGDTPDNFSVPDAPVEPDSANEIQLGWNDAASDEQESFSFELVATPVHISGQRGEPSDPITVDHPGSEGGACSAAGTRGLTRTTTALGLAGLVFLVGRGLRRRRQR